MLPVANRPIIDYVVDALRDAATDPAPGRLTVVYERDDGGFED
jgi:UTP-glucose-1-phosphate uridylyltransferase